MTTQVNLGCGTHTPYDWINVDYAFGARISRLPVVSSLIRRLNVLRTDWPDGIVIHDLRQTFPWADNSVDHIYSSHTLEHLNKQQGRHCLKECFRVLKPGGVLRIVVPDLDAFVNYYTLGRIKADDFVDALGVCYVPDNASLLKRLSGPFVSFPHNCMYSAPRLLEILRETGFSAESKAPFESAIPGIHGIELADRTVDSIICEAQKPPR